MKNIKLDKPPRFLTHHLLLRPDCMARLTLPTHLTQQEAYRLSNLLDALVMHAGDDDSDDEWPYEVDVDPDDNLDEGEIDTIAAIDAADIAALEESVENMSENSQNADTPKP